MKDLIVLVWMSTLIAITHIKNNFKYESVIYWIAQLICVAAVLLEAGDTKKRYHRIVAFIAFILYMFNIVLQLLAT